MTELCADVQPYDDEQVGNNGQRSANQESAFSPPTNHVTEESAFTAPTTRTDDLPLLASPSVPPLVSTNQRTNQIAYLSSTPVSLELDGPDIISTAVGRRWRPLRRLSFSVSAWSLTIHAGESGVRLGDDTATNSGGVPDPGDVLSPGGARNACGALDPCGVLSPGGAPNPGGALSSGGALDPGGGLDPGGTLDPGGALDPSGALSSGGALDPGGAFSYGGVLRPGGALSTGGAPNPGDTLKPGGRSICLRIQYRTRPDTRSLHWRYEYN